MHFPTCTCKLSLLLRIAGARTHLESNTSRVPAFVRLPASRLKSIMADDIRRRSACDRCHSQKLRCPRRPGQDICDRCSKARASCAYSPFRQKKLPQDTLGKSPSTTHSQSETIRSVKRKRATSQLQDIGRPHSPFVGHALITCLRYQPR